MSALEKMVDRAVRSIVEEAVRRARREDRTGLDVLRARVLELEFHNLQHTERIRALERANDHRSGYVPQEVMDRLTALYLRLRAIG